MEVVAAGAGGGAGDSGVETECDLESNDSSMSGGAFCSNIKKKYYTLLLPSA